MKIIYKIQKIRVKSVLLIFIVFLCSCQADDFQKIEERSWSLTWSDEFDGQAGELPDATKWNIDLGNGQDGWGNLELQNYTKDSKNISLDGEGHLVITAINEGNYSYTSARINTQNLFSQKYGRFEANIITPYGPGIWPAFWMLGADIDEVSWPQCGEIDIMELKGYEPHVVHSSLHGPGYSGGNPVTDRYVLNNKRFDTDTNLFAVEWDAEKIDFFVNDYLYQRILKEDVPGEWVYDHEFFIILNLAVGGSFVGFPTELTPFPQKMIIDYVRVYK